LICRRRTGRFPQLRHEQHITTIPVPTLFASGLLLVGASLQIKQAHLGAALI
jgi:hypothetical protein